MTQRTGQGHAMETLVPETLSHLLPSHTDVWKRWVTMLLLEMNLEKQRCKVADIWCMTGWERCVVTMVTIPSYTC